MSLKNLGNFNKGTRDAERQLVLRATETIRAVSLDAFNSLRAHALTEGGGTGSPVASGRLAASMRLEINGIDTSVAPADPNYRYERPSPWTRRSIRNPAVSRIVAKLRTLKLGDKVFISNSVPYIRKIEIGSHSWQTPQGVFVPTMRRVVARFRNVRVTVSG